MVDERRFIPGDLEQALQLHEALVDAEICSHAQASGIVMWLARLPTRRSDDPTSDQVRRVYRHALLKLGRPPWEPNEYKGA
jgi:hypothetical protein